MDVFFFRVIESFDAVLKYRVIYIWLIFILDLLDRWIAFFFCFSLNGYLRKIIGIHQEMLLVEYM